MYPQNEMIFHLRYIDDGLHIDVKHSVTKTLQWVIA